MATRRRRADASGGLAVALVGLVIGASVLGCTEAPEIEQVPVLRIRTLAYADDGTLLASTPERIVALDPALNELSRTRPPYPFTADGPPHGVSWVSTSRDGRVAAAAWQSTYADEAPITIAGSVVFELSSRTVLRRETFDDNALTMFHGSTLSPDGTVVAASTGDTLEVSSVASRTALWSAKKGFLAPPVFTGDGAALIVAGVGVPRGPVMEDLDVEVVRASDGAHLLYFSVPGVGTSFEAMASADGTTCGIGVLDVAGGLTIFTFALADGAMLSAVAFPADVISHNLVMAMGPHGDVAVSFLGITDALMVWRGEQLLFRQDGEGDHALAFSPDGTELATASDRLGIQLRTTEDGVRITGRAIPETPP